MGTEVCSGSGGRIDAVVRTADGYIFYEIKVGLSLQSCIRVAVGQLLEYSYWPGSQRAHSLVIVGEARLDTEGHAYIEALQKNLNIPISYQQIIASPLDSLADSSRDAAASEVFTHKGVQTGSMVDAGM